MSDKPQQDEDLLEQIITDGLKKLDGRKEDTAPEEAFSEPTEKTEPSEPEVKPNKRSSVYIYLFILFAAAFLMLLLAYFVQLRMGEPARPICWGSASTNAALHS